MLFGSRVDRGPKADTGSNLMKRIDGWGVTGWSNGWTALGSDDIDEAGPSLDGYGVQRTVDPGVVYVAPPKVPEVPVWHPKPLGKGRVFEMEWREDTEPATRSLVDIQKGLASRRKSITSDDPDLGLLDAAVDGLLSAAAALHAGHTSLGFVQADSCRVGRLRDGKPFVVLPDVGFAWDKRSGLVIPRWIASPLLALLFERGAEQRNEDYLLEITSRDQPGEIRKRAVDEAASDLADVKIIARLLAVALVGVEEARRWCGSGTYLLRLPSKDAAPDTQAEIWDRVIGPALEGQIRTCEELRTKLKSCRPSSHYLHVPPTPPWSGWPVVRRLALGAVAAAVLGLLWAFSGPIVKWLIGEPAPFCRAVSRDDPLYGKLTRLRDAHEAARGDIAARPAFWTLLRECLADHAALRSCGRDCLGGLVGEWMQQAEDEGRAVRERLRSRPRPTPEERRDISAAIAAIRQAAAAANRGADDGVVPMLERELLLRGGKPAEATP